MKNSFAFIFFITVVFLTNSLSAQDLILTVTGDSMNVHIKKVKNEYIEFEQVLNNKISQAILPLTLVKVYQTNYFAEPFYSQIKIQSEENTPPKNISDKSVYERGQIYVSKKSRDYSNNRIGIAFGYSNRLAKISSDLPPDLYNYVKRLRHGFNINVDIAHFLKKGFGLGVKYSLFKSSNSPVDIYVYDASNNLIYGTMQDRVSIHFAGLMFSTRKVFKKDNAIINFNLAPGILFYKDKAVFISPFNITGKSFWLYFDINGEYFVSKKVSIGLGLALTGGVIDKIKVSNSSGSQTINLSKGNYENITRLDLSVGPRFYF
jgi:hypothetical protein